MSAVFVSHRSWAFLGLIGVLAIIATIEYFRMLRAAKVVCFPRFGMLLAVAYCVVLHWFLAREQTALPDLDALRLVHRAGRSFHPATPASDSRCGVTCSAVAANVLGFVYIAVSFQLRGTAGVRGPGRRMRFPAAWAQPGAFLLLWLLAVTKFTDMGAYITGSLIGRHKMIPHVSPGKTWEGFGGALVFSQLAGCGLLYALFPAQLAVFGDLGHVIALGFLLAMLAVIGDLAESVVKRALERQGLRPHAARHRRLARSDRQRLLHRARRCISI